MRSLSVAFVVISAGAISGCAAYTPVDVARPSDLTLTEATSQIADGLIHMKRKLDANRQNFGLLIDQVDVDLNVTASAGQGGTQELKIDAAKTALAGVGLSADIAGSQTSSAQRQNAIHMTFKNIYTANLNCAAFISREQVYIPRGGTFAPTGAPTPPAAGNDPSKPTTPAKPAAAAGSGGAASPSNCRVASAR